MRLIDIEAPCKIEIELDGGKCHATVTAPTVDAVPVCRCRDCDMWNEEDFSGRKSLGNYRCSCAEWSNLEDGRRVYTGPDEFCSRGERKGGNE
jgi:hypothetical protein